jgi:ribosomal subunit interface protein
MKTQIDFENIAKPTHATLQEVIRKLTERLLGRNLSRFDEEQVRLHAHLEKSRHRDRYLVKLELHLPDCTLAIGEASEELTAAIQKAFDELHRKLDRHVARIRHKELAERKEPANGLYRFKNVVADRSQTGARQFAEILRPQLAALQRFVQNELAYLRLRGELGRDYPTVDDMVDEALASSYRVFREQPDNADSKHWLYRIVLTILTNEVMRRREEEGVFVSLDAKVPTLPNETMDDESERLFEYWKPTELSISKDAPTIGEASHSRNHLGIEARNYLAKFLIELPNAWRRAIVLSQAEGYPLSTVALQLNAREDMVQHWIAFADAFLRARLGEVGLAPVQSGHASLYFAPVSTTEVPKLTALFNQITAGAPVYS